MTERAFAPASASPSVVRENSGYCPCCRNDTVFVAHNPWLRDHYLCSICFSVPRQRHLQLVLDQEFPGWEALKIHESSPSHDFVSRYAADYSSSQFFPDVAPGSNYKGTRNENLEALTFADNSLDLFITQDVLEHVFRPDLAIAEVHRVLRPGGAHVFTAPKHKGLIETRQRARLGADGAIEHLLPEDYHHNPVGDHRSLVTWDYGYDFEELMSEWAGASVQAVHTRYPAHGLEAEFNEVFVIRKPGTPRREFFPSGGALKHPGRVAMALYPLRAPARTLVNETRLLAGKIGRKAYRETVSRIRPGGR